MEALPVSVVVFLLVTCCAAVDVSLGSCPEKQVVENFQVERYAGTWYELERYWQIFQINGKCVKAEYTLDSSTGVVSVRNSQVDSTSGEVKSIEGSAVLANGPEGKLAVTLRVPVVGNRTSPYWVLDTDYTNYALVYSCSPLFGFVKVESAWILSRSPNASASTSESIEKAIVKANLRRESFQKTTQDCGS